MKNICERLLLNMVSTCLENSRSPENVLKCFPIQEYVLKYGIFGVLYWKWPETLCRYCVSLQTCHFTKYSRRVFLIYQLVDVTAIANIYFLICVQYSFTKYLGLLAIVYVFFLPLKGFSPNFSSNLSKPMNFYSP